MLHDGRRRRRDCHSRALSRRTAAAALTATRGGPEEAASLYHATAPASCSPVPGSTRRVREAAWRRLATACWWWATTADQGARPHGRARDRAWLWRRARGALHEIEIDNMKEQTAARDRAPARRIARPPPSLRAGTRLLTQVVAVVAGEGNKVLFRSLGRRPLVEGGQSMNPSAEDLCRRSSRPSAPSVIILPNNRNIIMTAEQTWASWKERYSWCPPAPSRPGWLPWWRSTRCSPGRGQRDGDAGGVRRRGHRRGDPRGAGLAGSTGCRSSARHVHRPGDEQVVVAAADFRRWWMRWRNASSTRSREVVTVLLGEE